MWGRCWEPREPCSNPSKASARRPQGGLKVASTLQGCGILTPLDAETRNSESPAVSSGAVAPALHCLWPRRFIALAVSGSPFGNTVNNASWQAATKARHTSITGRLESACQRVTATADGSLLCDGPTGLRLWSTGRVAGRRRKALAGTRQLHWHNSLA